jgi:acetyl-CoA acetyltransferase
VLACLRLPIDPDRLNVNGGAIALAIRSFSPALLTTTLSVRDEDETPANALTMCVGGGMGAADL